MANSNQITLPNILVDAVKERRAILFLGAGASAESLNSAKEPMPTANQIRDKLAQKYLNTQSTDWDLKYVVELAILEGEGETLIFEEISKMLSGFKPSEAHRAIPKFNWRAIFSTNYDTLIEEAYRNVINPVQECVAFVKDKEPYDTRLSQYLNPVPLLKLHGCINHRNDSEIPLVLTPEHYYKVSENRKSLLSRLESWAHETIIIFIGYRLQDPHINELIYKIELNKRPKWFMVTPNFEPLEKKLWEHQRIELINSDFSSFMNALESKIDEKSRKLSYFVKDTQKHPILKYFRSKVNPTEKFFYTLKNDLEYIYSGMPHDAIQVQKFYSGFDNGWCGIINKYDFPRRTGEDLLVDVLDSENRNKFFLLKGSAGAGKTIALKRFAFDASTIFDELVFWQSEEANPSFEFFQELYELTGKRMLLFVDQISLHSESISQLIQNSKNSNLPLLIIGADREADWKTYCRTLDKYNPKVHLLKRLSEKESTNLVELLEKHNCLGQLANKSKEECISLFMNEDRSDRQLLVALHELTQGKPFEEIVLEEYTRIIESGAKEIYLDIATMHQFGVPARIGAIQRISGISYNDFEEKLLTPLSDIIRVIKNHRTQDFEYFTRHSRVAKIVFEAVLTNDKLKSDQFCKIIEVLDPGYSSDYRIIKKLCKGRKSAKIFKDIVAARAIFETALKVVPNSAHFLQQFAILEFTHNNGSLDEAEKYAKLATEIDQDNHTFIHTLAEVIRRKALRVTEVKKKRVLRNSSRNLLDQIGLKDSYKSLTYCNLLIDETLDELKSSKNQDKSIFERLKEETIKRLSRAKQEFPNISEIEYAEARFWVGLDEKDKAVESYSKVILNPKNEQAFIRLADLFLDMDKFNDASTVIDKGISIFPNDKSLNFFKARLLVKLSDSPTKEIEYYFKSSFSIGDNNHLARFLYGQYLFWSGEYQECSKIFKYISQNVDLDFKNNDKFNPKDVISKFGIFKGRVTSIKSTFFFILDERSQLSIFASLKSFKIDKIKKLEVGSAVKFEIDFNYKGPIAINVELDY